MTRDTGTSTATTATDIDWRAVADELAIALRQAILRNPTLPAWAWEQAQKAIGRYDAAGGSPAEG